MKVIAKICIIAIFAIILLTSNTYARWTVDGSGHNLRTSTPSGKIIDEYSQGNGGSGGTDAPTINRDITPDESFNSVISAIFGVAAYICYAAAVIVVLVKGVKFMDAAPDAKAEIKKEAIGIVVGAFITFGIGAILQIIANTTARIL